MFRIFAWIMTLHEREYSCTCYFVMRLDNFEKVSFSCLPLAKTAWVILVAITSDGVTVNTGLTARDQGNYKIREQAPNDCKSLQFNILATVFFSLKHLFSVKNTEFLCDTDDVYCNRKGLDSRSVKFSTIVQTSVGKRTFVIIWIVKNERHFVRFFNAEIKHEKGKEGIENISLSYQTNKGLGVKHPNRRVSHLTHIPPNPHVLHTDQIHLSK